MAYASTEDVAVRMIRTLSEKERAACEVLLEDIAVLIDRVNDNATADAKKIVSCRAVARLLGSGEISEVPIGASQGSMSALGYAQSWTIGSGGAVGELYLSKTDKNLLGAGNQIGSYSPVEKLIAKAEAES